MSKDTIGGFLGRSHFSLQLRSARGCSGQRILQMSTRRNGLISCHQMNAWLRLMMGKAESMLHGVLEKNSMNCVIPKMKQSNIKAMVWAAVMLGKKAPLVVLEYPGGKGGGMKTERYIHRFSMVTSRFSMIK